MPGDPYYNFFSMQFIKAADYFTVDEYVHSTQALISESRDLDASVIPHSEDELIYRYNHSIVGIEWESLIGHLALYPTDIEKLAWLNIGEMWSVIIRPWQRKKWYGEKMVESGVMELWNKYAAVLAATINEKMEKILNHHNFQYIRFPTTCYEWWKKYLSPLMQGWVEEFARRAKCLLKPQSEWIIHQINQQTEVCA